MTAAERQRRHRLGLSSQREEVNMTEAALLKVAPPLPATRTDLLAQYKLKRRRSINDLVEEIVVKLWDKNENFMKYVDAIYNEQAVEGSLDEDDTMAALIIRDVAEKDKHVEVAKQNLRTIKLAMRVCLRRFGVSRPEREEQATLPAPRLESIATQAEESAGE
jgi:hypothetical protein